jgi:hypothetical protein
MTNEERAALVGLLRRTYRKEYAPTGSTVGNNANRLHPFPILAVEVPFNPDGPEAADLIEGQAKRIEELEAALQALQADTLVGTWAGSTGTK